MIIKVRPMNRCMACCRPAGTTRERCCVTAITDYREISLRMATQAKVQVPHDKHFFMNGAVDLMAGGAAFTERFMLKNKRPALLLMAFKACFINII